MARAPLFPYRIEVVTDLPIELPRGGDLRHIVVPPEYRTPHRSLYKARALQYALERSSLPDGAWILHLDEESHITPRLVAGIRDAVSEEERSGQHRIGQGAILYHRNLRRHPVMTLADMIRTGDDFGRFYCQQRLGVSLFGLHGSFILVRNSVERAVGFDFGRDGSITEDAFWALVQMQRGYRTRWVDGYMVEQSPQSVADFVKQRRRWFIGLIKVVRHAPVALRFRLGLLCSVVVWSMAWLGILYSYVNLVAGFEASAPIQIIGNVAFATFIATYVLGLKLNLDELPPVGALRAVALYVAQVVLIPVFALLEAAGVLYALVKPDAGFHVIRKEQS
jgi:egghead protein (zeste-white 4 protein)